MKYKLDEKIIEKGTYVISKSAVWCWDEENSSWISRCVAVLDIDKFNEKIKDHLDKKTSLLDLDEIIDDLTKND